MVRTATRTGCVVALFVASVAIAAAQGQRGRGPQGPPEITGKWTGTWSSFNPAKATEQPKEMCKQLDAEIVRNGDVWVATFEGDCGRPYKYTITMEGRQAGKVVMFKGSADLGPRDGGVYDWIGRASDQKFVGFFTSAGYTGIFSLKRSAVGP